MEVYCSFDFKKWTHTEILFERTGGHISCRDHLGVCTMKDGMLLILYSFIFQSISDTETALFPWITQEAHTRKTLGTNLCMVNESAMGVYTPIHFYKLKAHIGVIGNEFADAIAKHAAFHNCVHDGAFPPPSPGSDPFSHTYWLAEENDETTHTTTRISLAKQGHTKKTQEQTSQTWRC